MKKDKAYLQDMLDAISDIEKFIEDKKYVERNYTYLNNRRANHSPIPH